MEENNYEATSMMTTLNPTTVTLTPQPSQQQQQQQLPKNKRLKNVFLFKEIVHDVLAESTMHGLSKAIKAKHWLLKVTWLAFLATSMGFFAKFSLNSCSNFFDYEVTTKIRRIYESPTIFPTVSICMKNKFTTDFGIDTIKKSIEYYKYPNLFNFSVLTSMTLEERYRDSDNAVFRAGNVVTDFDVDDKKKLGHSLNDFLIECKFDDVFCNVSNDFVWYFDNVYGNCWRYNSGFNPAGEKLFLTFISRFVREG